MTTNKIYYSPELPPHVFAKPPAAWLHDTGYLAGILVSNGGNTYFCLVGHTSTDDELDGFATDLAAGKWLLVTSSAWTLENAVPDGGIAVGAGRISAVWDRGAGDKPMDYIWRASTKWVDTVTAGNAWRLYLASSRASGTADLADGLLTFGDAGLASTIEPNLRVNGRLLGYVVGAIAANQRWVKSGYVSLFERYIAAVGFNGSATKALSYVAADHWLMFQPVPTAIQASA
jgi:hypothetical protein